MTKNVENEDFNLRNPWRLEMALQKINRAIRMAEVRAQPVSALLRRLPGILDDDDREPIVYHLKEIDLNESEAAALARHVEELSSRWEQLPSRDKSRADSILAHLIVALPDNHQFRFALKSLAHRRKRRREMAYKVLNANQLPVEFVGDLLGLAENKPDQDLLHLIARNPSMVAATDERYLLNRIEEPYWKMRVIEALLSQAPERAVAVANEYPLEFVRAVGRLCATQQLPVMQQLFAEHRTDPDFLGIYAWALGRVGDSVALKEVRRAMEDLQKQLAELGA